jgi:FdhD protein
MEEEVKIRQYKCGKIKEKKDFVVNESIITLVINNYKIIRISISPSLYREFVYGYLFTSNIISAKEDINDIIIGNKKIEVNLLQFIDNEVMLKGAIGGYLPDIEGRGCALKKRIIPEFDCLIPLFNKFSDKSKIFKKTGGTHSAALSDGKEINYFAEDIGRHNAIDKVVGMALLDKNNFSKLHLLTSGRISSEIVRKAFYSKIAVIISHSAPTSLAIKKAKDYNITLIGFLRDNRFNIY